MWGGGGGVGGGERTWGLQNNLGLKVLGAKRLGKEMALGRNVSEPTRPGLSPKLGTKNRYLD